MQLKDHRSVNKNFRRMLNKSLCVNSEGKEKAHIARTSIL